MNQLLRILFIIALLSSVFLTGCDSFKLGSTEVNTEFVSLLKEPAVKDVNHSITIEIDPSDPGYTEASGTINLIVYNQSQNSLKFPAGSNVQIFQFHPDEKKWEEIPNAVEYYGEGRSIDPKGSGLDFNQVTIIPVIKNNENEQQIRVAVTGYIITDGQVTKEPVSAYNDFPVKP